MFRNLNILGKLPQMRLFWFLLPVIFGLAVFYIFSAPSFLAGFISTILLLGASTLMYAIARDAAKAYYAIGLERNELRSIVVGLEDALVSYDTSFQVIYFNPAAEKLFDLKADEIVGRRIQTQDAQVPKLRILAQVVFPSLAPVMVPRSPSGVYPELTDINFTSPDLELRVSTSPVLDENGATTGFIKVVRDRTREVSLMKSKNEFITVASHQLRTPTTEISWALEALAASKDMSEQDRLVAQNALASCKDLSQIIEDLLSIAKIEEGHFGYNFEQIDLAAFLEQRLAQILPVIRQAGIKLYFDKPEQPLPPVFVDPQKISLVFSNLLENAVRYNTKNGEIIVKIETADNPRFVKVSVKDTGIGVSPDDAQKLFTKFFRSENAVKFQTKGSGLGLYIAKNIVAAHGGQIGVESELNRGSTFYFTLATDRALVPTRELPVEY